MKNFHVKIRYNGYFAAFDVLAPTDSIESVENSILDKLGKKEVIFEKNSFTFGKWITYEEVSDDRRPIQYETVLGTRVAKGAPEIREGQS